MVHNNFNVFDLEKSLKFYQEALNMHEVRRIEKPAFTIVYLEDGSSSHQLELTWMREMDRPYDLGDEEFHLAFRVDDFAAALSIETETLPFALNGCSVRNKLKEVGAFL